MLTIKQDQQRTFKKMKKNDFDVQHFWYTLKNLNPKTTLFTHLKELGP